MKCNHYFEKVEEYDVSIGAPDIQNLKEKCIHCDEIRHSQYYDNRRLEPLVGRRQQCPEYLDMDGFDYEAVKSAVEFYKRYEDIFKLKKEKLHVYKQWVKFLESGKPLWNNLNPKYENWLFDYSFRDVIK